MISTVYFYKIFLFYKNVISRIHPVAFFRSIFISTPVIFLTHLYKSVICSFNKRCSKIVIKRNSSAKFFLKVTKGIECLQQNALDKLRFSDPDSEQV